jgi:hypothetical protein
MFDCNAPRFSLALATVATLAPCWAPAAGVAVQEGVFCNRETQLDAVVAGMGLGLHPRHAVEIVNGDTISCTYVDVLAYLLEAPEALDGSAPMPRYRADLVGVLVGGRLRPVSPPAEVFFIAPLGLTGAALQRRL